MGDDALEVMCSADPEDEEVQRFIQYIKQMQNNEQ